MPLHQSARHLPLELPRFQLPSSADYFQMQTPAAPLRHPDGLNNYGADLVVSYQVPLGGLFDPHKSHRIGVDIDVNRTEVQLDANGRPTGGEPVDQQVLTRLAESLGGRRVPEEQIHYRFSPQSVTGQ